MKIYTKFGDKGQTALFNGARVRKDDLRIETYGTVDELNSHLGLALVDCRDAGLRGILLGLQRELFSLGADLATPRIAAGDVTPGLEGAKGAEKKVKRIGAGEVAGLEQLIDAATAELPALKRFILPGGGVTACRLHVARTVCRRAERLLVSLMEREQVGEQALIYLNRLSDLLFCLARRANQMEGVGDVEWDGQK